VQIGSPGWTERGQSPFTLRCCCGGPGPRRCRVRPPHPAACSGRLHRDDATAWRTRGGPSTYWIDQATQCLRARLSQASDEPFASGNITYLRLVGAEVVAGYDYAPDEEGDAVDAQDFLELLIAWRRATVDFDSASTERLPPPEDSGSPFAVVPRPAEDHLGNAYCVVPAHGPWILDHDKVLVVDEPGVRALAFGHQTR